MRKDLFAIPIFEDKVDLDKIIIENESFDQSWDGSSKNSILSPHVVADITWQHLNEVISRNVNQISTAYKNPRIFELWRNLYTKTDYQDPHIHPHNQWSFIIYETVDISRTVFMNPARKVIMNQWGMYASTIPMDFVPNAPQGSIVIFPSWVEHFVMNGNEGTTIAGNVYLSDPPKGPNE